MKLCRYASGLIVTVLLSAGLVRGQVITATITGIVKDPSGAHIPGAQLRVTSELTGQTRTVTSNQDGYYVFALLPIGLYTLAAEAKGFKESVHKGLALSAGQTLTLDLQLEVGVVTQTVTVSGAPSSLNYTSPEQRESLTTTDVHELPAADRDWTQLLSLGTGIELGGKSGVPGINMNGLPPAAMNITIDGTNAQEDPEMPTIGFFNSFSSIQNIDSSAISEISITQGIAPASSGASMSGNINIITKTGTNKFHGSALEYNDNSAFDARNQFVKAKYPNTLNQFGATLGGPILKDRLFFFGNFQVVRHNTFATVAGDVPTPQFVASTLAVAPEYAPIFKYFPSPTQPYAAGAVVGVREAAVTNLNDDDNSNANIDYIITPNDQLNVRASRSNPYELAASLIPVNGEAFAGHDVDFSARFTHSKATWTAATRVGFNRSTEDRVNEAYSVPVAEVEFDGFDIGTGKNFVIEGNVLTGQEDIAISRGKHTIEFGGLLQRNTDGRVTDQTSVYKYSSLSDFDANIPSSLMVTFPLSRYELHAYTYGGYVQDAFRMTNNFTLNIGTRYDYFSVPKERDGRLYTRDYSPLGPGTGPFRPPSQLWQAYWPNFSPRAGFAWSLGKDRNTVVRAGFGVFFNSHLLRDPVTDDVLPAANLPYQLTLNRSQALSFEGTTLNYPVNKQAVANLLIASGAAVVPNAIDDYYPNPYSLQWMFDVQHSFGHGFVFDTRYTGTRGIHEDLTPETNLPNRQTGIAPDSAPGFGEFEYYEAADESTYHGWQSSLERRFTSGLEFGVNYTWSSLFAYSDGDLTTQTAPQDNNDVRADHAPSYMDYPNNFNAQAVYMLPFDRWARATGRVTRMLLGGWEIASIITAGSQGVFNVTNSNSSYPSDRPNRVNGVDPYFANYRSTLQWVNKAAFATVPIVKASGAQATPGNLSRDFLRSPGAWTVNLSPVKTFSITERVKLQLRADFLNAFNHTNLGGLVTNISSSNFGALTSATARTIQLAAKITF